MVKLTQARQRLHANIVLATTLYTIAFLDLSCLYTGQNWYIGYWIWLWCYLSISFALISRSYVCLGYKIHPLGYFNGNLLQILPAVILRMYFGNVAYNSTFLSADYFNLKVILDILVMNCHVKLNRYFDWQAELTKHAVMLLRSASKRADGTNFRNI